MSVRLMDKPEDFKKLGINSERVEIWEDARRSNQGANNWEWWYFDAIMDDGTTVVIQFFTKPTMDARNKADVPAINFQITLPDGTHYTKTPKYDVDKAHFGTKKCDVRLGNSYFTGDLKHYDIYVEPVDGLSATLHIDSKSAPFRPGTAYFDFGRNGNKYYTWLCSMPKGEVTGTITVDGMDKVIHGYGYHDHQWGNFMYVTGWNHWTWARQRFEDYTLILFDMTASRSNGGIRFPMCYLEDKKGNIVYASTKAENCRVKVLEEYTDDLTKKIYPKKTEYIFRSEGKEIIYTLESKKIIDAPDISKRTGTLAKVFLSLNGLNPSYARYTAKGTMVFKEHSSVVKRNEPLIYEFMYPGKNYKVPSNC